MKNPFEDDYIYFYIHIPFCYRKCPYCAFLSFEKRLAEIPLYLKALRSEIESFETTKQVKTIYFGGGTPSLLKPHQIEELIESISKRFKIDDKPEITLEMIPVDAKKEKLKLLKRAGVNRISLGVQSFNERKLKILNRIHSAKQSLISIENTINAGIHNISIDLIYGLKETEKELTLELKQATELDIKHISTYMLSIEKNTPFYKYSNSGKLPVSSDEEIAKEYLLICDFLKNSGFEHYEISNFSKKGYESIHNSSYWLGYEYKGFGLGASSFLGGERLKNPESLKGYITGSKPTVEEKLSTADLAKELFMLNLRLSKGVNINRFTKRFGMTPEELYGNKLTELKKNGLIEQTDSYIRLKNEQAMLVSNRIFAELI